MVLLVAAGGFGLWWVMQQPMYRPGALAGMDIVDPPRASTRWEVQPGVELSWFAVGEGANVLVVHGGPGIPQTASAPAFDALGDAYRFHYYAQRGAGESFRPAIDFSGSQWENIQALESALGIGQQLADIERIRLLLGDERLLLVGHSYGALLAALYAAEMPWHVRGLVLIAPANLVIFPSSRGGLFDNLRDQLPAADRPAYDAWVVEYFDLGGIFTKTEAELAAGDAELVRFFAAGGGSVPVAVSPPPRLLGAWHARAQYFSMGRRHDYSDALGAIAADPDGPRRQRSPADRGSARLRRLDPEQQRRDHSGRWALSPLHPRRSPRPDSARVPGWTGGGEPARCAAGWPAATVVI